MLQELMMKLIADHALREEFSTNPAAVFARFDLTERDRFLIRSGDRVALSEAVGSELMKQYESAVGDLIIRPFYPGSPALEIRKIELLQSGSNPLNFTLDITATWAEPGLPPKGLPTWFQVIVFDDKGKEFEPRPATFVVPDVIDFTKRHAQGSRTVTFPAPGTYGVVIDAAGSPNVLASAPKYITIPPRS
jgi:hypothetical protein